MRICIVDDSRFMRDKLESTLTRIGHEIVGIARHGEEGLELVKELKPDLVTLDIMMPIMDGLEALVEIKKLPFPTKVLMVSSHPSRSQVLEAIEKGADDFITKPFNDDSLQKKLALMELSIR